MEITEAEMLLSDIREATSLEDLKSVMEALALRTVRPDLKDEVD